MSIEITGRDILAAFLLIECVRLYKRVGRRCRADGCGYIWIKTFSKVVFAPEEDVPIFRPTTFKEWIDLVKRLVDGPYGFRLWIRNVYKETFVRCKCGHIESIKNSERPISVFHVLWIHVKEYRHVGHRQFDEESGLATVSYMALLERKKRGPVRIGRVLPLPIRFWLHPKKD